MEGRQGRGIGRGADRRSAAGWALLILGGEKVVQHAFVTSALAADAFDLRGQLSADYRWFLVSGAAVGLGFLVATVALALGRAWALRWFLALASVDLVGEFVAQAKVTITVTVSFLVALTIVMLALRELRRERPAPPATTRAPG